MPAFVDVAAPCRQRLRHRVGDPACLLCQGEVDDQDLRFRLSFTPVSFVCIASSLLRLRQPELACERAIARAVGQAPHGRFTLPAMAGQISCSWACPT